jgi:hypothetical protein
MQPEESSKPSNEYDGIYFLPGDEEDEIVLSFFDFNKDMAGGTPIENTSFGYKYHIAFFKKDEDGIPLFDEAFEAILGDPATYIKNLNGSGIYGCVVKKTEKSGKWFDDYLERTLGFIRLRKMGASLKSLLEN